MGSSIRTCTARTYTTKGSRWEDHETRNAGRENPDTAVALNFNNIRHVQVRSANRCTLMRHVTTTTMLRTCDRVHTRSQPDAAGRHAVVSDWLPMQRTGSRRLVTELSHPGIAAGVTRG
jgi:hypothetical protein